MEDISMNFNSEKEGGHGENSEEEENEEIFEDDDIESLEENDNIKYKSEDYSLEIIIKKFKDLQIIKSNFICPTCLCYMTYYKNNRYMDKNVWRFRKDEEDAHDNKINVRKNSVIENIKADIRLFYFIIENILL